MITRERLEELIKNNGKICHIFKYNGECVAEVNKVVDFNVVDFMYALIVGDNNDWFETQEEAEFALRYQNITRTETLSLPTWEVFMSNSNGIEFIAKNGDKIRFHKVSDFTDRKITLYDKNGKRPIDEEWEATKENYLEACELCRKLFLGEEVK